MTLDIARVEKRLRIAKEPQREGHHDAEVSDTHKRMFNMHAGQHIGIAGRIQG